MITRSKIKCNNGILLVLLLLLGLTACEKEVHISLGSTAPRVVVQGQIETGTVPFVVLTSTISFFATVDLTTLQNSFLHDAIVTVNDGSRTITLKEYAIDTGNNNKFYVYSVDTGNVMIGEVGKFYKLSVIYDNKTYTATTKIPAPQGVDSMWFAAPEFSGSETPATAMQLFVNYLDPDTLGDNVRYFTGRNSQGIYPSGIYTDEVVNGKRVDNIGLIGGYPQSTQQRNEDSLRYFFPGDTVTLKWCAIDKGVYKFWNSVQFAQSAAGNPFASPINLVSNLSGGALGVWAGYGSYVRTMVVPQ